MEDPVYVRWKRQHPRFPGVAKCVAMIRQRNVQGGLLEIICDELLQNAKLHASEVIKEFLDERDDQVRRILLAIISEAKLPESLPVFVKLLRSEDESLRYSSELGLRNLDTPESRKALWEAGLGRSIT
jgi:HEAT repeat protein